jgi:hypothetical protein
MTAITLPAWLISILQVLVQFVQFLLSIAAPKAS